MICPKIPNEPDIEFIPVATQELVVIVPLNHPLAKKSNIYLIETIPYPHIAFDKASGLRDIVDSLFQEIDNNTLLFMRLLMIKLLLVLLAKVLGLPLFPICLF